MFKTILLALDGSERSADPVRYAAGLADEADGRVVVVHVRELHAGRGAGPVHLHEPELAAAVHRQAEQLRSHGLTVEEHAYSTFKNPAEVIVRAADRFGANVIVTGGSEHRTLLGAVIGSTPQALLHRAPCPVLVAPDRAGARLREPVAA